MVKTTKYFLIIFCTLWSAFSITGPALAFQSANKPQITISDLINKLPARDRVESELINFTLLQFGPEGIQKICKMLVPAGAGDDSRARYALNGLSKYVTRPNMEPERQIFANTLLKMLQDESNQEVQSFLIRQLQIAGKEEAVADLSQYLFDQILCQPAAMALIAIATPECEDGLLKALFDNTIPNQVILIKALGGLKSKKSLTEILKFADSNNPQLRGVFLFALANIGDPAALIYLTKGVQEASGYEGNLAYSYYLLYAQRRGEQGDKDQCNNICREILTSDTKNDIKSAALSTLVENSGPEALENLLSVMDLNDNDLQSTALQLASSIPGERATQKWLEKLPLVPPKTQSSILAMLGRRGDRSALPAVLNSLASEHLEVRLAAIKVVLQLDQKNPVKNLLKILQTTENPDEIKTVRQALLQLPTEKLTAKIVNALPKVTPASQIVLLEILSDRRTEIKSGAILKLIKSEHRSVRLAAIKTVGDLGGEKDINKLIQTLLKTDNQIEQSAIQKSIVAIGVRSGSKFEQLFKKYQKSKTEEKILLLQTIGRIGENRALQLVVSETENKNPQIKDAAIRTLAGRQDQKALQPLLKIAKTETDETFQILAIRGCLRILDTAQITAGKKIRIYKELFAAAQRPEEKKSVIAGLGNTKTPESLEYVVSLLQEDSLKTEAALAAFKIAIRERGENQPLKSSQVILAMVNALTDEKIAGLVNNQYASYTGLNNPPEGFTRLFNGKDLTNWKGLVEDPVKRSQMSQTQLDSARQQADISIYEHWRVEDGILIFDGKGHSLCTVKDYTDFEMYVDWKIEKDGDSGIYLRGSPQVQIWDTANWPEGSGGLNNNQKGANKPSELADNPVGEWNQFRIKMIGESVTVFLNDVLVVEDVILENYWERDIPIYPTGQIELQAHSTTLSFRNIFIRELPKEKELFTGDLFNSKDLTGWQSIGSPEGSWQVKNKILSTEGKGGGWISTDKEFENFILDLDFRVPPGGNSGVFIRAPHQGDPAYSGMEIQVLDDYGEQYADLNPWQYTGSIYGVQAPAQRVAKKADKWQHMTIFCNGPLIKVTLNGTEIINTNLISHMDKEKSHPGLKRRKGYIGLQNHSTRIEYRNIKIEELTMDDRR